MTRLRSYKGSCAECDAPCDRQAMRCKPCADTHRLLYSQGGKSDSVLVSEANARDGCKALLRAHLRHAHWISDPAKFADAVASLAA